MSESDFLDLVESTLDDIETAVESTGADIELTRTGNVLTLEFENASKIVVNSQAAVQEIWVAARAGGYHFRHSGSVWLDTRDSSELFAALSRLASGQGGQAVLLSP